MLATIHWIAQFLNQYANLLMVVVTIVLVALTGRYVVLTSHTLTALKDASLRDREAHHLREIKEEVIRPIVSWIRSTVVERFTGKTPELLMIWEGNDGKLQHVTHTVDDPFRPGRRLKTPSDPDVPDLLGTWTGTEFDRITAFLYGHSKQAHFPRELSAFDRLLEDVRQLTGAIISFANESAKEITDPDIPQALSSQAQNAMPEWTNPHVLAVECIQAILQGKNGPGFQLTRFPGFHQLTTTKQRGVGKAAQPEKLQRWSDLSLSRIRKRWEHSDLPERVRNLLKNAASVSQSIEQIRFTQSLGIDCELVSGKRP
jgi:hypothetical protein